MNKTDLTFVFIALFSIGIHSIQANSKSGQITTLEGYIYEEGSNTPIPSVYVKINQTNIQVVTDRNGKYLLEYNTMYAKHKLIVSRLGYETLSIDVDKTPSTILLKPSITHLNEVNIKGKGLKTYTKGIKRTNTELIRMYGGWKGEKDFDGFELGRKFAIKNDKPSYLEEIKFYIKKNALSTVTLGINIYTLENDKPVQKVNTTPIILTKNDQYTGWISVDLVPYDFKVQEDIVVTLEYIKGKSIYNRKCGSCELFFGHIPFTLFTPPMYHKDGVKALWEIRKNQSLTMTLTYRQ